MPSTIKASLDKLFLPEHPRLLISSATETWKKADRSDKLVETTALRAYAIIKGLVEFSIKTPIAIVGWTACLLTYVCASIVVGIAKLARQILCCCPKSRNNLEQQADALPMSSSSNSLARENLPRTQEESKQSRFHSSSNTPLFVQEIDGSTTDYGKV
jgi:hypothetical protein